MHIAGSHTTKKTQADETEPLVLGVTGHRDLRPEDFPDLEQVLRRIFSTLLEHEPERTVSLLSPLAEGADRLVADSALEYGAELIVPLPMKKEFYATDFQTAGSRSEFERLLLKAASAFVVPFGRSFHPDEICKYGTARDYHYGLVGAYIVQNCHVLIALWNGLASPAPYGTADVVGYALRGIPDEYHHLRTMSGSAENCIPVIHVVSPRVRDAATNGEPLSFHVIYPDGSGSRSFGTEWLESL